jgi:hypothetical protein
MRVAFENRERRMEGASAAGRSGQTDWLAIVATGRQQKPRIQMHQVGNLFTKKQLSI